MFHRRRWLMVGFIALSVVAGWRLSFWMPQPIVNAQEASKAKQRVASKPIDGRGEKSLVIAELDAAMDRDAKQLATRVRTAKEPEKTTLRAELEKLTEQHFEQRQQRRETEIAELADRVDKLRVAHHRRQENKPEIIRRRITDLLDAEKELKWEEASRPSPVELNRREVKSSNSDDSNKQVATAALIRTAEARRTLAALEYKRVIEANKQVPGAIPNIQIERLKANLEIAEAELDAAKTGVDISRSDTPKPTADGEPTFDGTAYSQWLKMLESERKPDKLATAIEACTRLAVAGDERRIVRGIFAATKLFEQTDDSKERNRVWEAGVAGLKRLPGMTVAGELLASAQDDKSRINHDFKAYLLIALISPSPASENLRDTVRSKGGPLIATFLEQARVTGENNRHMLSRATSVWLMSGRKLTEFDGFQPQLLKAIDDVYSRTTGRIDRREEPWFRASMKLAETEPETPELAALFAKYFEKDRTQIYARLTRMGRHAEVAVPRLIETFLVLWKKRENEMRAWAANSRDNEVVRDATFDDESPLSSQERMVDVLKVLGAIGPGAKAAVPLLQQIVLLAPPKRVGEQLSLDDKFFDAVKETLAKIGEISATDAKDSPASLSEFFRLQSRWNLTSTKPEVDHKDIQFDFNYGISIQDKHDNRNSSIVGKIMNQLDTPSSRMHFRINDTASPRQIDLIHEQGERTQLGIYELSANRLKIQLAKPGKPRPKEFSPDKDKLPEGHTLLEFERDVTPASEPVP